MISCGTPSYELTPLPVFVMNLRLVATWFVQVYIEPDDHIFPFVLKECADCLELQKGMEILGVVFKMGFDLDVFVGNALVLFYVNCGYLTDEI